MFSSMNLIQRDIDSRTIRKQAAFEAVFLFDFQILAPSSIGHENGKIKR